MTKRFFLLLSLFCLNAVSAQIYEIGIFAGASNYIGDVGATTYIRPNEPAFGALFKWNRSPRHSWRISYTQTTLSADDRDSDTQARQQRGLKFKNDMKELSLGLEFDFFDFNLHDGKKKLTPYVYSGLSAMMYNEMYYDGIDNNAKSDGNGFSMAIPMIVGIKTNVADHFVIGLEAGARWTFTDNIDGSAPKNETASVQKFGNINNKDWYMFTGLTLTYTFGNKPCYCAQ
ncbi:type IX secretion system protein PorG [Flavobacterium silvaticum]|uniref:DUF6089 domain-containing protein n=1 Tax=Flavobacterium silvaticum TaxID=1852020 RepID=A0A972JFR7_9FLAO|nr:DUF6089 family protein [Flavobacterium silvaticum]NMH27446.1 hypothetical protein [Flavobacterium silvaticum]